MLEKLFAAPYYAADTETTGLNATGSFVRRGHYPDRPFAFSFTLPDGSNEYVRFPVDPYTRRVRYEDNIEAFYALQKLFARKDKTSIWHNALFDLVMLHYAGMPVQGHIRDTKILAHAQNSSRKTYKLKPLCAELWPNVFGVQDQEDLINSVHAARRKGRKLGYAISEKEKTKAFQWYNPDADAEADYWLGDEQLCATYAVTDTDRAMAIYWATEELYNTDANYRGIVDMEHELIQIAVQMKITGHRMDVPKIEELEKYYAAEINKQLRVKTELGFEKFNPASPAQMKKVFYGQYKLPEEFKRRKRKNGTTEDTLCTDNEFLNRYKGKIPLAKCLLQLSSAEHQLGSFILPFKKHGIMEQGDLIIHPNFNTCGPVTGRLSCSNPNLMNITNPTSPKPRAEVDYRVRECFIPRKDHVLYYADYEQVELWILGFSSKDPLMCDTLLSGDSMHTLTAKSIYGTRPDYDSNFKTYRARGKIVNFAIPYGATPPSLKKQADCPYDEAVHLYNSYWTTYTGVDSFNRKLCEEITTQGFTVDQFGRRYFLPRRYAYRALNYRIQGPASTVMKRAMIAVNKLFNERWPGARILLSIHDELVMEVPNRYHSKKIMREIRVAMANNSHEFIGMPKPFPIEVSCTSTNWSEKKKVEL